MNHRGCSYGGYSLPEPEEKVIDQIESLGFKNAHGNTWIHPDHPDHKLDISHTEEDGLAPLLYETYFLAGYKKKEDEIKLVLNIK